jgi:hypothetical protein
MTSLTKFMMPECPPTHLLDLEQAFEMTDAELDAAHDLFMATIDQQFKGNTRRSLHEE